MARTKRVRQNNNASGRKINIITLIVSVSIIASIIFCPLLIMASSNDSPEESMIKIEKHLQAFKCGDAYEEMKALYGRQDLEKKSEIYLRNLVLMIKTEKMYNIFDEMVKHAIELYELTETTEISSYRIAAIDALAYFEYYNFNNSATAEKLGEILQYKNGEKTFQYLKNKAFMEIDEKDYSMAISLLQEALKDPALKDTINLYFSELSLIHYNIADILYEMEKKEEALVDLKSALNLLDPLDIDFTVLMKVYMARYYYSDGQYNETREYLEDVFRDYEKTSPLLKKILPLNNVRFIEGDLEYQNKNYKKAADIYYEITQNSDEKSLVEENIVANQAMMDFNNSQMDKQLSLLEQLAAEQMEKNMVQTKYLTVAYGFILLLIILVISAVFVISFFNKQRKKMYSLSITDQLTQLYNRRKIVEMFGQIEPGTKCVALIDVDDFKSINDNYGHLVGDEVLRSVAETIRKSLRIQDEVGRYGGEEFLIILDTEDTDLAIKIIERIRINIENIAWDYPNLKTTISVGLTKATEVGDPLLAKVDQLMYASKSAGRNRLTFR